MRTVRSPLTRTALRAINRAAWPLDRFAASRSPGRTTPLMVVGLPRSGTTLVYELLVQALDIAFLTKIHDYVYGMPNLTMRATARGIRNPIARYSSDYGRISGRLAPAENSAFWERWLPEQPVLGHYMPPGFLGSSAKNEARETLASMEAIAGRPFVFKNVYLSLSVVAFLELIRDARVILVRRNIEAVIASMYNKRRSLSHWWSIKPPFSADLLENSVLEQTVFQCVRSQQIIDATVSSLPASRCMVIDYESVCDAPAEFANAVAAWVGDDIARRQQSEMPEVFTPSKGPTLSPSTTRRITELVQEHMSNGPEYLARLRTTVEGLSPHGNT